MRKVHECLKGTGIHRIEPIKTIELSDPLYDTNVDVRYQNDDVEFNYMEMFQISESYLDDDKYLEADEVMLLLFKHQDSNTIKNLEKEEHLIGVDSASYGISMNEKEKTIYTASDGIWGDVTEFYKKGTLEAVRIKLAVPDMTMSAEEFYTSIESVVGFHAPMKTIYDRACDVDLDEENVHTVDLNVH